MVSRAWSFRVAVMVAIVVAFGPFSQSDAGWNGGSSGGGSSGGGSGGSSGGGYVDHGSDGGSGGSHGGLFRRGRRGGRHGSSGGSTGGSSGGSYGGSSGGSFGGSSGGSYGGTLAGEAGDAGSAPAAAVEAPADGGLLVVEVPEGAKIAVNGKDTEATGTTRYYVSRGMTAGKAYAFTVKMTPEGDEKAAPKTRTVSLSAGQKQTVSFLGEDPRETESKKDEAKTGEKADEKKDSTDAKATASPKAGRAGADKTTTNLILDVPADATVRLQGKPTSSEGTTRSYATTNLAAGERWEGYRVEVSVGERTVTRLVTLVGGTDTRLTIDAATIAAADTGSDVAIR